jgi:nickel-dependent lactate racemase
VHEAFLEAASFAKPAFAVTTIVNDQGDTIDLYCGDWIASHLSACAAYAERNTIRISEKRDVVIVSCGGWPYDINMVQAHKALEAASQACRDGGTIVLLAECAEGLGHNDFLNWFFAADSAELAERLCESYQVNGQTAWSLLRKTERFKVEIITKINENETHLLRMQKINEAIKGDRVRESSGYILPLGARVMIRLSDEN